MTFLLIDTVNTFVIDEIEDGGGMTLTRNDFGLSVEVVTSDEESIDKMDFYFDGIKVRTEGLARWALGGNNGNTFFPFGDLQADNQVHSIRAVAMDGQGNVLGDETVAFTLFFDP